MAPGLALAGAGVHVSNIIIHPDPHFTPFPSPGGSGFTFGVGDSGSEMIDGDMISVSVVPSGPHTGKITISVTPNFTWQTQPVGGTDPTKIGGLDLFFSDFSSIVSVTYDPPPLSDAPVSQASVFSHSADEVLFNFATNTWTDPGSNVAVFDYVTAGPPIPEPATWVMMLVGFAGIGAVVRRRAKVAASSLV